MKPSIKLGSLLLAIMMAFTAVAAGCSFNKEWSYKTSEKELPIGVYIYCLNNAYATAKGYAEKLDGYDSEKDSWLDMEITDDDGNKEVARKWIKYGISLESFSYSYADMSVKQEALFYTVYGKGGSKEVKDDELNKFFTDKYVSYSYYSAPLYTATTDEAGQQSNVAMSDKKIKELKDQFNGYAKDINGKGKSLDDVNKAYQKKSNDKTIEPTKNTEQLEKVSMGDDFKKALEKLGNKKATTITVGEKENAMLYFIYKDNIKDVAKTYLKDGQQKKTVLAAMKSEEFTKYLKDLTKEIKYEKNSAVDGYDPKMFFEPVKATTAPATTVSSDE